tara:strand:- start:666 stop:1073 length:408 start_codon:yes stop_codon:yes gene_type:complete
MKKLIQVLFSLIFIFFSQNPLYSQKGETIIMQSIEIERIIEIKKELNKNASMLRIQIYNGNRDEAKEIKEKFEKRKLDSIIDIVYETPNYKIWVGNYINQLEADRKLLKIKKYYSDAFIFRQKIKEIIEEEIEEN